MEPADLVTASARPNHIPIGWLLLDVVGMALVGSGFAILLDRFSLNVLIPDVWAGWLLIVTGLILMLPLYLKILKAVRHYRQADQALVESLEKLRSKPSSKRDTPP